MEVKFTVFIFVMIIVMMYIILTSFMMIELKNIEWPIKLVAVITVSAIFLYVSYIYFTINYPMIMVW